MPDEEDLSENPDSETSYEGMEYEALKAIVATITSSSSKLIVNELHRIMATKQVAANAKNNLMPYLSAAALLSFSGREITRRASATSSIHWRSRPT